MNKDVIYIDVEDDVTAIIGKIKASKEKIIALVPPKRAGVLQSAVNLRLLDRMAGSSHKRLVVITNNQALIALSAAAGIPVAKNLQSKPELAEITALSIDDDEDIIDGSSLPVGELEKTTDRPKKEDVDDAIDELDIDDRKIDVASGMGSVALKKPTNRNGIKVPNFNSFRKKLFIGITAGVLLIIFLIWANLFAPSANVVVTAKTIPTNVSQTVTLGGTAATDVSKGIVQSTFQQVKKDASVDFDATGTKDVGAKASGEVVFKNCEDIAPASSTIAAGTIIVANGQSYATQTAVSVPGGSGNFLSGCTSPGTSSVVAVVAVNSGTSSNTASGTTFSVSGHSNSSTAYMRAVATADIDGGTTKIAKVPTELDVQKALDALNQLKTDDVKKELIKLFTNGEVIIDDSFTVERAAPVSAPAVGAEAPTGKAKLTSSTTYTISAVAKADVETYLRENINKQISEDENQRIYDTGISKVKLTNFTKTGDTATVKILTTGQVGPKIEEAAIKDQIKGKKSGEAQSVISKIDGVDTVQVQYSYFWVTTLPSSVDKITIEFKLQNG